MAHRNRNPDEGDHRSDPDRRQQQVHQAQGLRLPGDRVDLGARLHLHLPGAVDDHHQFQDRGRRGGLPAVILLRRHPGELRRRIRPRHGPLPAELVVRLGGLNHRRDGFGHPGGVRAVGAADREVAGRAVLLHLHQVHAGGRLDHPGVPAVPHPGTAGQPVVARGALRGHEPAPGGVDDAVVLLRGAAGGGRGGADRRGRLQPRAVAGVAAHRGSGCRRRGADLLHLRLERVLPGQPAHRRGGPHHPAVPGQLRRRSWPVPGHPVGGLHHRGAAGDRRPAGWPRSVWSAAWPWAR